MIDRATLTLLVAGADPAISIYLPIDPEQRDLRRAEARLGELVGQARDALDRRGLERSQADAMLAPAAAAELGQDFARHRQHGLAFFLGPAKSHVLALPEMLPETVCVGQNFALRPLLPMLARQRPFHILALSAGHSRLLDATAFTWSERKGVLPESVHDVEAESELQRNVQYNPPARPRAASPAPVAAAHATESAEDVRKAELLEHLHRVAAALAGELGDDPAPVVLAAEPQVAGHFRKLGQIPQIYEETLGINPHALADRDLHRKAVELVRPWLDSEVEGVLDQVNARLGTAEPTVAIRLEEILSAAYDGRVDAVIVAADEALWGHYDHDARAVHAKGGQNGAGEDLLNEAAVVALRKGGRAFALPKDRLPRRSPAVAILRY